MSAEALRDALNSCVAVVAEDERFWQAEQQVRDQMMTTHDTAKRLLGELPKQAEAVA